MENRKRNMVATRKQALLMQGILLRNAVADARHAVRVGLRPEQLAREAASRLFGTASHFRLNTAALKKVVPLALGGISLFSKGAFLKRWLRRIAIAGSVAGMVGLLVRRR